ncbi:hypothetical protein [Tenacibaculum sp. nBUS_03]|uniref:hypothetical protein n=1 Tax=Tenacibaculum sp. nBUS_03 TaxID=3395320 RepID=UPI003EBF5F44
MVPQPEFVDVHPSRKNIVPFQQVSKAQPQDIKLQQVMDGADDWNMVSFKGKDMGDVTLQSGLKLELDITVPEKMRGQGVLEAIMKAAVNKFKPTTVKGTWKANFNGKPSTNYKVFMKNKKTMSLEDAAFSTPTGKAAQRSGFGGKPIIKESSADGGTIDVIFTPSKK